jgi:hypothetical protein
VENPIRHRVRGRGKTGLVVAISMAAVLLSASVSLAGVDRARQRFEGPTAGTAPLAPVAIGNSAEPQAALPVVVASVAAARRRAPIPARLTPSIDKLKGLPPQYMPSPQCIGHDKSSRSTTDICRIGVPSSRKVVVLMGDSHAMMWLPAVVEMAKHDRWAVVPLLRLGCTPSKWAPGGGTKACRDWYRWAIRQIDRLDPRVILLGGSVDQVATPTTRAAVQGVVTAAGALERIAPTVVIGDPESLSRDPVDCLLSRSASMASCTTTWPVQALAPYDEVARRVASIGAGFLRTRGFVCFQRQCPAVIGRTIAWADDNHLSAAYSAQLSNAFRVGFVHAVATSR